MSSLQQIYQHKLKTGDLDEDPDQAAAVALLDDLVRQMHHKPRRVFGLLRRKKTGPKGIYFYGGVGRGKSMVMDLFFSHLGMQQKRRVHFHAFMLSVHDFLHDSRSRRKAGEQAAIDGDLSAFADKIARETRVLCFDEFQVKDVADAMILGRLFTALFDLGVVVVMTSNIAPDRLYEDGLQRDRFLPFIAFLKERMTVFEFTGTTDYRLGRLRDLDLYFRPHDDDARRQMKRIFETLSDGAAGEPAEITAKGRTIRVPMAARETAWFTFHDLCETPKSALDYLELAKRYRVFIIEDVPRMDDRKRDAALRFITLIDTLYDHHARVIISAADTPEALYTGEDHAKVFARTASRLMEMQSKEYKGARE